ncbi:MAG: hypothetical protein AUH96_06675 [Nitrospirae bacterium 13_2_20CM_2_61_4]|nr:MAG: hypothetical protein AUH96_06675 [Nitrospirae bacterium 13_2_20CM_2_61_4]
MLFRNLTLQILAAGLFLFISTVLLCFGTSAHAQRAEADVLVAQAVLAYDNQEYDEALSLLKRALDLDPRNARGLYYSGLVYLAKKQPAQAVAPLETLQELRPADIAARFQLGVAYFIMGEYDKAQPLLESVFQEQPTLENLGYYVGFMRYRQKDYAKALEAFEATKTSDPNIRQLVLFYRGLSLGVLGLSQQAIAQLEEAQRTVAVSPITDAAVRIRDALAAGRARTEARRFRAQLSVGGFYDDNVAINPNPSHDPLAESLRARKTTAPGILASALADYSFIRQGPFEATVSYSFLQTVNLNDGLSKFNIQDHLGGLAGFYRGTVAELPYQLALQYTYDYLLLDQDAFLARHTPTFSATLVEPTVSVPGLGTFGNLTTALVRYQVKEFFREPGGSDIRFASEQRDALNTMVGVLHVFRFAQDRYLVRIGYQYDNENAKGVSFSYTGNRLQTGAQATLPWGDTQLRYDYDVHWQKYKNAQTLFVNDDGVLSARDDVVQTHLAQITKPLLQNLTLTAQYQRIRDDSNIPVYDYTKNVFSLILTWAY